MMAAVAAGFPSDIQGDLILTRLLLMALQAGHSSYRCIKISDRIRPEAIYLLAFAHSFSLITGTVCIRPNGLRFTRLLAPKGHSKLSARLDNEKCDNQEHCSCRTHFSRWFVCTVQLSTNKGQLGTDESATCIMI